LVEIVEENVMKIVFFTQYRENYDAHDWDGEGECPQHWKCKGGSTYVVENVSAAQAMDSKFWGLFLQSPC
jgi:hypothetical protein